MIDRICISLNKTCNMACTYCHFFNKKDKIERINDTGKDKLNKILENVTAYAKDQTHPFKIGLVGSGEPTISFDLIKDAVGSVSASGNENIHFYTISNGLYLTDDMLSFLKEHKNRIDFNFSLDGTKALHDKYRLDKAGKPTYDRIIENIRRYESVMGEPASVNCTIGTEAIADAEAVLDSLKGMRPTFSRLVDSDLSPTKREFDDFLHLAEKRGFKLRQTRTEKKNQYDCTMYGSKCGVGRNNLYYSGGKVYPCGRFIGLEEYVIGAYDTPLEKIEETMAYLIHDGKICYYEEYVV